MSAAICGVDLEAVYAVLHELEAIVGDGAEGAGRAGASKKSKKAKERSTTSYTGLPFSVGSLSLTGRGGGPASTTAVSAAGGPSPGVPRAEEEKQSAKAATARRVAVLAEITTELQPASSLFRRAAISEVAAEADKAQHDEEGSGLEGVERKSAGALEHSTEEEAEKVEVAAKYLFVHRWLLRLLQAAEHVTAQLNTPH